jgi:hypothetical protein
VIEWIVRIPVKRGHSRVDHVHSGAQIVRFTSAFTGKVGTFENKIGGEKGGCMALRHHSTDTVVEEATVTEVDTMGSTIAEPTNDTAAPRNGNGGVDTRMQRTEISVPGASVGLILGGFLAFLISAWAGIVPFAGPVFGFSADGSASWTWNEVHALGAVVPGAVGMAACVIVMVCARRPMGLQSAGSLATAGFVLFLCGAWLAAVPVVWPVLVGTYFHAASPSMTLAHWMGYSSGPGVLLAGFGGLFMGRAGRESSTTSQLTVA